MSEYNMTDNFPILDFDENRAAIIMPDPFRFAKNGPIPARGVLCFFQDVIEELQKNGKLKLLGHLTSEIGEHPVYEYLHEGTKVVVFQPGVGAPLSAAFLEELIAVGVTKFIVCGACGALNPESVAGHPVVLTSAVRDEGTSYHYLPPAREVKAHTKAVVALEKVLQRAGIDYLTAKTWTTDAIYRETKGRRNLRMQEGCEVVEMEAAALFAVAQFREIPLGQVVYTGDLVIPEGWDARDWNKRTEARHLVFDLAVQAVLEL